MYGNGWWGVLEINYGVAAFHLISAVLGPEFWELRPLCWTKLTVAGLDGEIEAWESVVTAAAASFTAAADIKDVATASAPSVVDTAVSLSVTAEGKEAHPMTMASFDPLFSRWHVVTPCYSVPPSLQLRMTWTSVEL